MRTRAQRFIWSTLLLLLATGLRGACLVVERITSRRNCYRTCIFHRISLDQTDSYHSKGQHLGFLLNRHQSLCAGVGGSCSLLTEDR